MSPEAWSVLGIVLALAILMVLAMRGMSILLIAPLCSVIVALFGGLGTLDALSKNYMNGFASFPIKFFFILLIGSVFGKYMEDSGAARSITRTVLRLVGRARPMRVIIAITIVAGILTYAGVSSFVLIFALMPIARHLFEELDIPWEIFPGLYLFGAGSFALTQLPGSAQVHNLIPMQYLGTTAMAGGTIGIVAAAVNLAVTLWYLRRYLRQAKRKGIGYRAPVAAADKAAFAPLEAESGPHLWRCFAPSVVLLGMLNVFGLDVIYALAGGTVAAALLFGGYIKDQNRTMSVGAVNSVVPLINTSAMVGFGTVVAAVPGFQLMTAALMKAPWHPLVSVSMVTVIVAAVTGSASGGLAIVMETMSQSFLATGVAPAAIHRLATMACTSLVLPSNGITITVLGLAGLSHREGYWLVFKIYVLGQLAALAIGVVVAMLAS